ncbi:beta carbonic anhydrase 5, chloroplastic-like, partial [Camellia sinensis]|uniref:beta carbonic anhydrase 5, chloroplastic-like n=1 Tax=Camellia sinensis TaxID=4442 RepID=UPI001036C4F0
MGYIPLLLIWFAASAVSVVLFLLLGSLNARCCYSLFKVRSDRSNHVLRLKAAMEPPGLTQGLTNSKRESINRNSKWENLECYENLAKSQALKFMVIGLCRTLGFVPPTILGFQPGEAFVVRNVANRCPHLKKQLANFLLATNFDGENIFGKDKSFLQFENILVQNWPQPACATGIRAAYSSKDLTVNSSFPVGLIRRLGSCGKNAKVKH